jgi:hypothetical protein
VYSEGVWTFVRLLAIAALAAYLISGHTDVPTAVIAGSLILLGPLLFTKLLIGLVMLVGSATSDR